MPTLVSLDAIVPSFYGGVRPTTTMVVHDLILPIAHGFQGASHGVMVYVLALLQPAGKTQAGDADVR